VTPVHSAAVYPLQSPMPSNRAATNTHSTIAKAHTQVPVSSDQCRSP
jgi:hypothetical protein